MIKRVLFFSALMIAFNIGTNAQAPLPEGGKQVNVGIGFSGWGIPIYAGVDFGVAENFTVGGKVSYRSYEENWFGYGWQHTIFTIAANGNYHFNEILEIPSKYDLYAGLSLGYSVWSTDYEGAGANPDYDGPNDSDIFLVGQVGGRYFFSDKIAAHVEFGGGTVAGAEAGITILL